MNKLVRSKLIKYELRNATGNLWSIAFGLFFPIFMAIIVYKSSLEKIPKDFYENFATILYISFTVMTINSIFLIGYAVNLSIELDEKVMLRLNLFGISNKSAVVNKLVAQLIIFSICYIIYTVVLFIIIGVRIPTLSGAIIYLLSIYLLGIISFILGHGIANIFQKFGPTYAISMVFMMVPLFIGGMMGIQVEQFPLIVQKIAYLLPYTYIAQDFHKVWLGESYNFVPFIQSMIFFAALSTIVLLISFYLRRRRK